MRVPFTILLLSMALALMAQMRRTLTGLKYQGPHNPADTVHQEGCEPCNNPGSAEFKAGDLVRFYLPGSDTGGSAHYVRKGNTLTFKGSPETMELKGDTLFFTACDHRHVYLRVRE